MKPTFEIGDRIWSDHLVGLTRVCGTGTIVCKHPIFGWPGVRFDERSEEFHDLNGACANKHGYWLQESNITHISNVDGDDSDLDLRGLL